MKRMRRRDLPFPRHWLAYMAIKIVLVLVAAYIAARLIGWI